MSPSVLLWSELWFPGVIPPPAPKAECILQGGTLGDMRGEVMNEHSTTVGNIRPSGRSTYTNTQRPPAPTLEHDGVGVRFVMPPIPTFPSRREMVSEPPRVSPNALLVAQAIIESTGLDLSQDQPYMPLEGGTTLAEAYNFMRHHGYILIQGGRIDRREDGYYLTMRSQQRTLSVTREDVSEILECNYPDPDAIEVEVEVRDTHPCPPPRPLPMAGVVGFCAPGIWFGVDIDDIPEDAWQPFRFGKGALHQLTYAGELALDGRLADVWFSLPLNCYISQFIPYEELDARRPPLTLEEV